MIGDYKMWDVEAAEAALEKVGEEVAEAREEREARKGRLLVVLDREDARFLGSNPPAGEIADFQRATDAATVAISAALDRDREELEALVIRAMMNVGKVKPTFGDYARAVLSVLEGADDE